jgi:hypothetical protein
MIELTSEEWLEISSDLEAHHALFYQCWGMGKPFFTDSIETAAVRFNRDGEYIEFVFNPKFWQSLTHYERLFVISHECLHIILNHGLRTINRTDPEAVNVALDIVVNHILCRSFGYDREKIRNWKNLCWVETVYHDRRHELIPQDESFEYYYRLLPRNGIQVMVLDDHGWLAGDWGKVVEKLNQDLTPDEKESIRSMLEKNMMGMESSGRSPEGFGNWTFVNCGKVAKKRKWETVIKQWSLKYLRQDSQDKEQWARVARRFCLLPDGIILPSEMEEDAQEKDRLPIFLMVDTSGSCVGYKERFWKAGSSLPNDRFDVRMFCFDTSVVETTLDSKKMREGGGTSFNCIEYFIRKTMKKEGIEYPEAVFVITDGYGDIVEPMKPQNWYWFLTPHSSKDLIPKQSKVFQLKDYE